MKLNLRSFSALFLFVVAQSVVWKSAYAQSVWRKQFHNVSVLLFKKAQSNDYYCTLALDFDAADKAGIVVEDGHPLQLWLRWHLSGDTDLNEGLYVHPIIDGASHTFIITKLGHSGTATDVTTEFISTPTSTAQAFFRTMFISSRTRLYLPNGQFRDADTKGLREAAPAFQQCLSEAADLNTAGR